MFCPPSFQALMAGCLPQSVFIIALLQALTSKQGDAQSFANIEERDKYYNKKLEELAKDKQLQTKQIVDLKREAEDKQSEMQASRDVRSSAPVL